jgi:hypothetical protein
VSLEIAKIGILRRSVAGRMRDSFVLASRGNTAIKAPERLLKIASTAARLAPINIALLQFRHMFDAWRWAVSSRGLSGAADSTHLPAEESGLYGRAERLSRRWR